MDDHLLRGLVGRGRTYVRPFDALPWRRFGTEYRIGNLRRFRYHHGSRAAQYVFSRARCAFQAYRVYPGHLYQHQYFMQNSFEYNIETLIGSLGTSEGWAYYVEKLSLEWAGLDEATADAYFTNMILGMAALSVVDIGVNYEGWGIEETSNFLTTYYGELDKNTCQNFIYRI